MDFQPPAYVPTCQDIFYILKVPRWYGFPLVSMKNHLTCSIRNISLPWMTHLHKFLGIRNPYTSLMVRFYKTLLLKPQKCRSALTTIPKLQLQQAHPTNLDSKKNSKSTWKSRFRIWGVTRMIACSLNKVPVQTSVFQQLNTLFNDNSLSILYHLCLGRFVHGHAIQPITHLYPIIHSWRHNKTDCTSTPPYWL